MLSTFFIVYIVVWGLLCITALLLAILNRKNIEIFQYRYWRFLFQPWKIVTFLIAGTGITVIAPYTGDPTWDYIDAAFMSIFTYASAPWAVGTLYLFFLRKVGFINAYIAFCVWMFSASWSYDLYLVFRDGYYPQTWLPNIFASSVLYVSAGLLWNLEWKEGRGAIFGFMNDNWPEALNTNSFNKIILYALPFIIIVLAMILPFII